MELISLLALLVFVALIAKLRRRMRALEQRVNALQLTLDEITPRIEPQQKPVPDAAETQPEGARPTAAATATADAREPNAALADEGVASDAVAEPAIPRSGAPRDYGDLERRFGTQWIVWIGGIALALGGIFFVRYSIESGLFGPGARIILGAILALVLMGLGEILRRREILASIVRFDTAHIPSILTAAGTTVAYADIYAAYALYDFLSPPIAFILLGVVALSTLALALLQGPALATLGLVGAFLTPALIGGAEPNFWALFLYLAVVTAATYALARQRLWSWLAATAAGFSLFWTLAAFGSASIAPLVFHTVSGFILACVLIVSGLIYGPTAERGRFDLLSCITLAGPLLGAFLVVLGTAHDGFAALTLLALSGATVAAAWRADSVTPTIGIAALLCLLMVAHWATSDYFVVLHRPGGPFSSVPAVLRLEALNEHAMFGAAAMILFGAAGFPAQQRNLSPSSALIWAATGTATPILMLIVLHHGIAGFAPSIPFAGLALLLAAIYGSATEQFSRRHEPGVASATALFACGAVASLALALTFALERGWLTIALALTVAGVAWISDKRPLPMLRTLCAILTAIVMVRIAWDPRIVGNDVGRTPILNWLLWGYGVPTIAFWWAGKLLRRRGDDFASRSAESAAILFAALTVNLQIRHLMNGGDIYNPTVGLAEIGLQVSTWLAMIIGLEHIRKRTESDIHDWGARIAGAFAALGLLSLLGSDVNPVFSGEPVGGPILNSLLLAYGIPAALLAILARTIRVTRPAWNYMSVATAAITMAIVYLTLQVRRIFVGPVILDAPISDAEHYTLSAVWLIFGVTLLLIGIAWRSRPARFASAAVVVLTVAKVFLFDLASAQGIYRALSFICLGLVLMGIGWLYQRLLFPRPPIAGDASPSTT